MCSTLVRWLRRAQQALKAARPLQRTRGLQGVHGEPAVRRDGMTSQPPPPLSREEWHHLWEVLQGLQPMGGHTLYDENGRAFGTACGERNQPPYVPGIRDALQRAAEAEV